MAQNDGLVYHAQVSGAEAGELALEFHVRRFKHSSREEWRARFAAGAIRRNGRVATEDEVLASGDKLEFWREPWDEPAAPQDFTVVFEDEDVLALEKPAGLQVLPAGPFSRSTLLELVRASAPERASAAPAHRLGRGTSGLIVFGKSTRARRALAHDFRTFAVQKTYLAWAEGSALSASLHARQPIGTRPHGPLTLACVEPDGQPSLTRLRVLRRERERMLIAAQPITGRANQIRIHSAACGAPLVGDPLYGPGGVPKSNATAAAGGYLLHAAALSFRHPADGRRIKLRSRPAWLE
jgi:23S rRNA pseudouridine1911/1915/1917 synthase